MRRQVLDDCQAVKLAKLTGKDWGAAVALCAEVADTRSRHKGPQRPCKAVTSGVLNMVDTAGPQVPRCHHCCLPARHRPCIVAGSPLPGAS